MADQKITELTNYTPPIDTDVLPIVDVTTSATKKVTWANIKATLKTYFDSLTTTLTNKTLTSPVINTDFSGTAKAIGSEIDTGTEDAKIVTPKAINDSIIFREVSNEGLILAMNFNSENISGAAGSEAVLDASTSGNSGTNVGATHDSTGGFNGGGCFSFDGDNDYITLGAKVLDGATTFSIGCWMQIDAENGNMPIYQERQDINNNVSFYYKSLSNTIELFVGDGDSYDSTIYSWDATAHYGEWHHWFVTFNAGTVNLYLDGVNVVEDDVLSSESVDTGTADYKDIGAFIRAAGNFLDGSLDDLRIYNRVLSVDEVKALYFTRSESKDSFTRS